MPIPPLTLQKVGWSTLAGLAILYCVVTLAFVSTSLDIGVRCLLVNSQARTDEEGLEVRSTEDFQGIKGIHPTEGDLLQILGGRQISSFLDLAQVLGEVRDRSVEETIQTNDDPTEERSFLQSTISFVQEHNGPRLLRATVERNGSSDTCLLPVQGQATTGIAISIVWMVIQLSVIFVAGLAHWHRPYDRSLRLFFISSFVTLVAFIGGSHWWVIASRLWLLIPFIASVILLPAVLLHFFLVYPEPRRWLAQRGRLVLAAVYAVPILSALAAVLVVLTAAWLTPTRVQDPLGGFYQRTAAAWTRELLNGLQTGITAYILVSAGYFVLSVGSLAYAFFRSRQRTEHEQVRWILAAAAAALIPLGYALSLVFTDRVALVFGGAQVPLVVASLLFTVAYVVGIIRHRMLLIDQVLNRGLLYYLVSFGLTLAFSVAVAYGTLSTLKPEAGGIGQPVLMFVVATVAVMLLVWLRDRLQLGVDREFFREKYQLDKALQRVNQAVTGMVDRQTLADRVLATCHEVLQANRGAIYLRDETSRVFYRLTAFGAGTFPAEFSASREFVETLRSGLSLQRLRSGDSPLQQSLRALNAELVHGLDVDGALAGMIVLGGKPNGAAYSAEDAAFLTAMGRMAGVTLHFGKVHEDLTRMNADFVRLNSELSERAAATEQLREQLDAKESSLLDSQRRIDALQVQLRLQHREGTAEPASEFTAENILGTSRPIRSVLETVRKVAASDASVLVRGESGTGKELLARAIHDNSPRREGPLITIHCAALAPGVLESELFGHVRGAFTDARQDKQGRFQLADGGTLFLDEIGDVPLETQVKLLRVLQERIIEPVGSAQQIPVNVRLIAATHRNLEEQISLGRFREDLYYRLNVVSITLPPLRERGDDVIELAVKFLHRATARTGKGVSFFDDTVLECFRKYPWPGNIRELENVVERAVVLAEQDRITIDDLPPTLLEGDANAWRRRVAASVETLAPQSMAGGRALPLVTTIGEQGITVLGSEEERQMLVEALQRAGGNKASAARLLGMPRSTYFSKLRKHGLD